MVILFTLVDITTRIYYFSIGATVNEDPAIVKIKMEIVGINVLENQKSSKSKLMRFVEDCSMYTNSEKLFRTDNGGKITCLNGLRLFSVIWIIFGHTFNYISGTDKFFLIGLIFFLHSKLN